MTQRHRVVFLLDVDNTLLDNDIVAADLRRFLANAVGADRQQRYWQLFEDQRATLGYADYLGALQHYRVERPGDAHILEVSPFLIGYHFADRLYPHALDVISGLREWGPTVIFSDGDAVFQPWKVTASGLWSAVGSHVLIYVHKEQMLDDVERRYPADHYVVIDDKLRILAAVKKAWGTRVTTVFPLQGHYALDPQVTAGYPPADVTVAAIGDLRHDNFAWLGKWRHEH
jgi:FMN phosphatase YigB (HAD superfamily)